MFRDDLIELELAGKGYKRRRLHKSFITKLFKNYETVEFCENFYDSEPQFDEEQMWRRFGPTPDYDIWSDARFQEEWKRMCAAYEDTRITFLNWQEPAFEGNWGMTQEDVDRVARHKMMQMRDCGASQKYKRFYVHRTEDGCIWCYWFGRDDKQNCQYCDYYWIMRPKVK